MRFKRSAIATGLSLGVITLLLALLGFSGGPSWAQTGEGAVRQGVPGGETAILSRAASAAGLEVAPAGAKARTAGGAVGSGEGPYSPRKGPGLLQARIAPAAPAAPLAGIADGGFEQGLTYWEEYSLQGWPIILNEEYLLVPPHGGSWAAWLGGEYDEISVVRQFISVPAQNAVLGFWMWIASEDDCGYDFGGVVINDDTVVDVFTLCAPENTNGWVQRLVDLSAYGGQTVPMQIRVETDESYNSNLFVDDVTLRGAAADFYQAFTPLVVQNWAAGKVSPFAVPCSSSNNYCEPFNTWKEAYGRLQGNMAYSAFPNDSNDYYFFAVDGPTSLTVQVTNFTAVGQVLVRNQGLQEIRKDVNVPPNADGNMTIPLDNLQPGKYFIQIFSSGSMNQNTLYTLRINQ